MNKILLISLLGATVTLATPSLSFADNGYKFKSGTLDHDHIYKHKHQKSRATKKSHQSKKRHQTKNKHKNFVAKPPKQRQIATHTKRLVKNSHTHNNHKSDYRNKPHNNRSHNNNEPTFSISWNVGGSTITYGNGDFNRSYNKRNQGKRIYKRIHRQANRIQQGVNNGQLVNREVRKLRREQRRIKQTLSHFKSDGRLNRKERSKMNQLLDVASNNIHRKSNNSRTRYAQNYNNYNNHFVQY